MGWAQHLPGFEAFAPRFSAGGSVALIESSADQRKSCQKRLGDVEDDLASAMFGGSDGEVFKAMRAHAKRLRDAVDSVSDAQQVLSKKISRYADKIDGTQRKLDNLRRLAHSIHSRHRAAVDAYNLAYQLRLATNSPATLLNLNACAQALFGIQREWDQTLGVVERTREKHAHAVDGIASDISAAKAPSSPISFEAPGKVTNCKVDQPGAEDAIHKLATALHALTPAIDALQELAGEDTIRGQHILQAVQDFDEKWTPYLVLVRGAVTEFKENAQRFIDNVRTADQAAAFDFSSMQLDNPANFQTFAARHGQGMATNAFVGTFALGFDMADASHKESLKHANRFSHLAEADNLSKFVARGGGAVTSIGGALFDYNVSRNEGYSQQTSAIAAGVGASAGIGTGAALALIGGSAVLTPPGMLALLAVGAFSSYAGNEITKKGLGY
ncbi:hypothetical protein QP446_10660 [Corynebacterium riegelii]|uniref:hypothetical protein n=1 Tax=Corynebacterium riegelii TaxID=156976 RepID=UPI002549DCE6|nr:hypothetical protein [Corynebacterium riegelii]MDK7181213.1 hypothetical protein [Corynebacterium riegelii]